MANGKPSDPDNYLLRSGVRLGLKREFAFAVKSQADLPNCCGRTRSGKVVSPGGSPSCGRKRSKKKDAPLVQQEVEVVRRTFQEETSVGDFATSSGGVTEEVMTVNTRDGRSPKSDLDPVILLDSVEGSEKGGLSLGFAVSDGGLEGNVTEEKPVVIYKRSVAKDKLGSSVKTPPPPPSSSHTPPPSSSHTPPPPPPPLPPPPLTSPPLEPVSVIQEFLLNNREGNDNSDQLENGSPMLHPIVPKGCNSSIYDNGTLEKTTRRFTRSALKVMPVTAAPITIELEENPAVVIPVSTTSLTVEQEKDLVEVPIILDEHGGLEFENGNLEMSMKAEIEGHVAVTAVALSDGEVDMDETEDITPLDKPSRRLSKSFLKATTEESVRMNAFKPTNGDTVDPEDLKGDTDISNGSLSLTPKNKLELKMSKKITLTKLPSNVRDLLTTGLLEGLPVKYISCIGKNVGLHGVIRGNGVLCSCTSCQGTNVVSAYQFEIHAGSTKKHPSDFIFLENGKSLRDVLRSCAGSSLEMLEAAIQNAIGPAPPKKVCICYKCKEGFDTARTGNFALLCNSCLQSNNRPSTTTSSYGISSIKYPRKVFVTSTSDTKTSVPDGKHYASDGKPKNLSSQKKQSFGKLTRKDLGLHKLVFMDDILPQGTEVGYYVRGKRLLQGYIKDSGIFCSCCNSVVSPSQFEAHAGQASRRKPYNYIYTSNGVSLHELSVSLSKDRKFSPTENDDLCGICADGGNLLLCDLCPRAFHKECVGLLSVPDGNWFCMYCENMRQKEKHLALNDNAIAAGRVAGVDPIEQIITRCIRIVSTTDNDAGVCALCRQYDFSRSGFDQRTVIICDQCETEYHVGCLKDNNMADLQELPEGEWFCRPDCSRIHTTLHDLLLQGPEALEDFDAHIIKKKLGEKGLSMDADFVVKWRLLSGKNNSPDSTLLLSQAVSLFHESFDPIVEPISGRDLIPFMVYCLNMRDQDFGGIYCMVLTVNSSVISAGLLRVLGSEVAELPIVATKRENRGLGFFQSLFSCIERLFRSLKVKHFVLPAAGEAESIWTNKLGFSKITPTQLREYAKGARPMSFQGTSMLHKPLLDQQAPAMVLSEDGTIKLPS